MIVNSGRCKEYCRFFKVLALSLLVALAATSQAQLRTLGQPGIGTGSALTTTPMWLDATLFPGNDMCAKIATACGSTSTIPFGTTIDARGFSGNQVCQIANVTKMLNDCGTNGGKLLLGMVNVYADGPGVNGNYADGHGSGIGTPAFIIPNNFWGIEGVSRGAGSAGIGTWLSICTGGQTPVGTATGSLPPGPGSPSCSASFPVRSFVVNSAAVSGNTMTINVSPGANFGTNLYTGELVMIKNNTIAPAENGTYRVQNTSGPLIQVTVPLGTPSCTPVIGNCGAMYAGTPILGFAPRGSNAYNTTTCDENSNPCSSFGMHIKNLGFNCQGAGTQPSGDIEGCMGWQNLYAQEESGADTFEITNYNFVGFDSHGNLAQNFGPITNAEILTGNGNSNCDFGTTGAYIDGIAMRGFDGWTINTPTETNVPSSINCGHTPRAALMLDAENTETSQGHCENFSDCVLVGANNPHASGIHVTGISEAKPANPGYDVEISANNPGLSDFVLENIQTYRTVSTPAVRDDINNITLHNQFVALYSWANNAGNGAMNLVTTDNEIRNQFGSGIQTANVKTGVTTNTDLAGQCTLGSTSCGGGGGANQYNFSTTYSTPPICTCSDTSTSPVLCGLSVTTTGITFSGTSAHKMDYVCVVRQ